MLRNLAPTDEFPRLTTLVIYFRPLCDVNDNEKCENRARKAYGDGKSSFSYDITFNRSLTLGIEVRGATNSARWELDTIDDFEGTTKGGPSHLRYEIPWNVRDCFLFHPAGG